MRSRYSAFAVGDTNYLLRTWHPDTAPDSIELDPLQTWYRLDIRATRAGGLLDRNGTVSFSAYYKHPDGNGVLGETSRFVRERGRWLYLDGTIDS
jgi:SEC-C motif domain protein